MIISWGVGIVDVHMHYIVPEAPNLFDYAFLCMVIAIYYVSYHTLMQPEIFTRDRSRKKIGYGKSHISSIHASSKSDIEPRTKEAETETTESKKLALLEQYYQSLLKLFETEKQHLTGSLKN